MMTVPQVLGMPRFGRRMSSIRPVNRTKQIVDAEGALTGAATSRTPIGITVEVPTSPYKPGDLMVGSTVNGIFLSLFIIGATGAPLVGSLNWYIAKIRAGQDPVTDLPLPGSTGVSEIRNQIFHEEKGLAGSGDGTPMAFKGVIAVPKGMRRMRSGDQFIVAIRSLDATVDATFCLKAIYNSYH